MNKLYLVISVVCALLVQGCATAQSYSEAPEKIREKDVMRIISWLKGEDTDAVFSSPFGDAGYIIKSPDPLLFTDVILSETPKPFQLSTYDFVATRMKDIGRGYDKSPAVLITRSVEAIPKEEGTRGQASLAWAAMKDERYYYVEVGIGNMAWHWMKIVIGRDGDKNRAIIIWSEIS
mgnify:CR=1 FL=1